MSLTPKNWHEFQHYKDRSPAWIKLHRGLLDDYEFSRLPVASRALAPLLWLLASEYADGKITASTDEIAFRFRTTERELVAALKPLIDKGFFITASAVLADCKRGASPEKKEEEEREIEEEKNIRAVAVATRPVVDDPFEEFWKVYPKRDGANPKTPARKKFIAAVKSGTDAREIIAAAKRSADEARSKGQIGTPYVPQAVTWLNQQRWGDYGQPEPVSVRTHEPPSANLPSDEELRRKYGASNGQRDATADIAEGKTADAATATGRPDNSRELLGQRGGDDSDALPGECSRDTPRRSGLRSLGDVLRQTPVLAAMGAERGPERDD